MDTITNNILYTNFIRSKPNLSEASKNQYKYVLMKFQQSTNQSIDTIINKCKSQQNKVIEKTISKTINENEEIIEKEIIKFDVNDPDSYINLYFNAHLNYCKSENNSNVTLNHDFSLLSTFLRYYNVELPKMEKYSDDSKDWELLSKEDINYVLSDSSLTHDSLITFLIETGFRIGDATNRTIGEFMEATKEYHDYTNVDDFIDNAPQDMIGTWRIIPNKTKRFGLECITCNGPDSSNKILQNLRRIKNEYFPYAKHKYGVDLHFSKEDALFGSKNDYFKGPISPKSITDIFARKNVKLRKHRINLIKEKINNGELSEEDFENEVTKIPRFHAHACRKYYQTMIARNCGDLRLCALMEGHTSPIKTDSSYIKKEVNEVQEVYLLALPDLSLSNVETKTYTSEARREMEAKMESLKKENNELKQQQELEFSAMWKEINDIKTRKEIWNTIKKGE